MKDKIINLIKENLIEIIPELEGTTVMSDVSLVDLGANSIDRAELITVTLERLQLDISRVEFATANSIEDIATLIEKKLPA
ncbi:poly(3-hydroxyalkanoate) depolymerase [Chitinophaga varians]|uniref:Poly(3-hydroxyalkanoate) depolymerase n=1 Tax=Chitinophaga varians TaxID=2202339 RepID=A0A847SC23_9BACT|nr:phosphopantetheine-binding protein [Chitinophaga varians]NLR69201.1 poly(3-hydroxyalkanoate) depolymerase [Chitinophaga varians]